MELNILAGKNSQFHNPHCQKLEDSPGNADFLSAKF